MSSLAIEIFSFAKYKTYYYDYIYLLFLDLLDFSVVLSCVYVDCQIFMFFGSCICVCDVSSVPAVPSEVQSLCGGFTICLVWQFLIIIHMANVLGILCLQMGV